MEAASVLEKPVTVINTSDLIYVNSDSLRKGYTRTFMPRDLSSKLDPDGIHLITFAYPADDGACMRCEILMKLVGIVEPQRELIDIAWEHYNSLAQIQKVNGEWVRV